MDLPRFGMGPPRSGMGLLMPGMGASRSGRAVSSLLWTSSGPTWALRVWYGFGIRGLVWVLRGLVLIPVPDMGSFRFGRVRTLQIASV